LPTLFFEQRQFPFYSGAHRAGFRSCRSGNSWRTEDTAKLFVQSIDSFLDRRRSLELINRKVEWIHSFSPLTFKSSENQSPPKYLLAPPQNLRAVDKSMADERERLARAEKMLSRLPGAALLGKPFEHEARLKELLKKRDELNRALGLDKGECEGAREHKNAVFGECVRQVLSMLASARFL
jgi:hypothetical protein